MVIGQQNQLAHQVVDAINCGGQEYIDTLGIRYRSDPLDIGTASNYGKMDIFQLIFVFRYEHGYSTCTTTRLVIISD